MIEVREGRLEEASASALLRPIASDGSAVTPAMRRLEMVAGAAVAEQLERQGQLPVGSATITGAGDLPADFLVNVIIRSTDEPPSASGVERGLLNGLRRLREWGIDDVAMPPLGTGAGNVDVEAVAEVMMRLLRAEEVTVPSLRAAIIVESDYEREVFERALSSAP